MTELTQNVLNVLTLVAALCGLGLFLLAATGFVLATYRVGLRRRPLVLPFAGSEEQRGALTALFVMQLAELEGRWVRRVHDVEKLKSAFEAEYEASPKPTNGSGTPLADGAPRPSAQAEASAQPAARKGLAGVGMAPRSAGDEPNEYVLALDQNSLFDADLGVVSLAGVSFSPQAILALLRRLPGIFARCRVSGTIAELGDGAILAVTYEELALRGPARRARGLVTVSESDWLAAIDKLAFQMAKGRVEVIRQRRRDSPRIPPPGSDTAERAFVEAESWAACEAFLAAYASHLRHYVSGTAQHRDDAIELYGDALDRQPGYTRAHYNRATLLYNRYLASDNRRAMDDFQAATRSDHDRLRALAFAGLAMAYGQEVHRFGASKEQYAEAARRASEQALALDSRLEESHFAAAWALQTDERWADAVKAYSDVCELETKPTVPGARMKSFAYNNSAWIALEKLEGEAKELLRDAEDRLWKAVRLYPNKIAYANLAEVARRHERYEDANQLFAYALRLDPHYVNGWHELARLQVERAALAAAMGDQETCRRFYADAMRYQERAEEVADRETAARVKRQFEDVLDLRFPELRSVMAAREPRPTVEPGSVGQASPT